MDWLGGSQEHFARLSGAFTALSVCDVGTARNICVFIGLALYLAVRCLHAIAPANDAPGCFMEEPERSVGVAVNLSLCESALWPEAQR